MSAPPPAAIAGSSAEAQAAAFASDERVYFNKESNTWRLEQEDGTEIEYDAAKGAWVPVLDEDLVKAQQAAYSVQGVDESTPAAPVLKRENKKRKVENFTGAANSAADDTGEPSTKRGKKDEKERKSKNTAIYVTNLPSDTTAEELAERFGKFGVLEEDDTGDHKIKMYAKDDGSFSGEALIVYFKEESVPLAITMLDEAELRLGDASSLMRVAQADFKHKGDNKNGLSQPRRVIDKKAATRRIGKMQKKLNEWGFDDGFGPQPDEEETPAARSGRVVVLRHMFDPEDIAKDASLLLDLKEDVRDECSSLGEVTNVTLYDLEPEGVMTVKFKDPLSAQACIIRMNGRFFDGRQVVAELFSGKERFQRSDTKDDYGEGDEAEKKRLDDFAQWLMDEGE